MPFLRTLTKHTSTHEVALNSSNDGDDGPACRSPVDQDDAFAELDQVPEREGEAPGELFDAGQGLDVGARSTAATAATGATAALLLLPQTSEQLWAEAV